MISVHVYRIAGLAAVALAAVGVFLPLLPTVPFLILAAFCFARSNPAWEKRLLDHPRYGPHLSAWRQKGIVSRKAKWSATAAFTVSIALGFATLRLPWSLIPLAVAIICGGWLWQRPER